MLELKKGADILSKIGGISSLSEAEDVFEKYCDKDTISKLAKITNEDARLKIANAISMMTPDAIFVNTGSEADIQKIREMSLEKGEEKPLAMKDHTIHFDLPEEQGRIVDRTFYIVNEGENLSALAKSTPRAAVAKLATSGKAGPRRELGLLAMAHSQAFVAQVAIGADPD